MALRFNNSGKWPLPRLSGHWARAVERGQRYLDSLWWLIKFGLLRRQASFWWLIALSTVALGAQALAVGVLFGYVRLMEGTNPVQLLNIPTDWLRSRYGLLVFVASVAMLLALNHLTLYRIRVTAIDWACSIEIYCGRLALSLAARLPDLTRPVPTAKAVDFELRTLILANARYCGLTIRLIVLSLPNLVALVGSMVGLFLVDWAITCIIVVLGAVIFLFQYPANLKGASATRRFQASRPDAVKQIWAAIESLRLGASRSDVKARPYGDPYGTPAVNKSIEAYADRMRAIEVGTLATQMGTTLLIGAIILFIGDRVFTGDADWASLLAYVSLLRVASGNFSGLARYTTSMARLYPQVKEFVGFVNAFARPEPLDALKSRAWAIRIQARSNAGKSDFGSVGPSIVERCSQVAVVTLDTRRAARPDFALALSSCVAPSRLATSEPGSVRVGTEGSNIHCGTQGAVALVACGRMQTGALPRDVMGLTEEVTHEDWRSVLDELRQLRPDLAHEIDACATIDFDQWAGPSVKEDRAGLVALIAGALARRASVIVLERDALKKLDCQSEENPLFRRLQRDSLVAIWYQRDQVSDCTSFDYGEQTVLICTGSQVEAVIELNTAGAQQDLASTLAGPARKAKTTQRALDEDLDDALF